jgi:hypothetical protein
MAVILLHLLHLWKVQYIIVVCGTCTLLLYTLVGLITTFSVKYAAVIQTYRKIPQSIHFSWCENTVTIEIHIKNKMHLYYLYVYI